MQGRVQAGRERLKLKRNTGGPREEEGGNIQNSTLVLSPAFFMIDTAQCSEKTLIDVRLTLYRVRCKKV
jgi:hypothetical protein